MGRHDWYRNETWNSQVEAAFRARLGRARHQKPQYLKIQAGYLARHYPLVALGLIDEYFATGDDFHIADALGVRACAYQALGKIDQAVEAYKQALDWEQNDPGLITTVRWDYPMLVAIERLESEYDNALDVLTTRFEPSDHQTPNARYRWNGICALIAREMGEHAEAREFAERAMRAAAERHSPYWYHPGLGLVSSTEDEFGRRIKHIAKPSAIRKLFRLIRSS